jgi:hypothetical protein
MSEVAGVEVSFEKLKEISAPRSPGSRARRENWQRRWSRST